MQLNVDDQTPLWSEKIILLQPDEKKTEKQESERRQSPSENGSYATTVGGVCVSFYGGVIKESLRQI